MAVIKFTVESIWPSSEWKLNSKDHVVFDKILSGARALLPQWGMRPFQAHERSKPGARYATRCLSESCLSESCLTEASSGITFKVMPDEASVRQDSLRHERVRSCLSEARTP